MPIVNVATKQLVSAITAERNSSSLRYRLAQ
jgi:hypothetical protein